MKAAGHGSNATESVYFPEQMCLYLLFALRAISRDIFKWLFLAVFTSSACSAREYICGVCQAAVWETEPCHSGNKTK